MKNSVIENIIMNERNHAKLLRELSLLKSDIIRRYSVVEEKPQILEVFEKPQKKYQGLTQMEIDEIHDKNIAKNVYIRYINRVQSTPRKKLAKDDNSLNYSKIAVEKIVTSYDELYVLPKIIGYSKNKIKAVKDAEGEVTLQYLVNGVFEIYFNFVMEKCIVYADADIQMKSDALKHAFAYLKYMINTLNFKKAKYLSFDTYDKKYELYNSDLLKVTTSSEHHEEYVTPGKFNSKQVTLLDVLKQREHRANTKERFFYVSSDEDGYSEIDNIGKSYNENYINEDDAELLRNHFKQLRNKSRNFDRIKSILIENRKDNASKKALSDFMKVHDLNCLSREELKYLIQKYC